MKVGNFQLILVGILSPIFTECGSPGRKPDGFWWPWTVAPWAGGVFWTWVRRTPAMNNSIQRVQSAKSGRVEVGPYPAGIEAGHEYGIVRSKIDWDYIEIINNSRGWLRMDKIEMEPEE